MKKTNDQNGITLIALVVTIVVLLILAGVTITYVLSDGGIFDAATDAGTKTAWSTIKEYADQMQHEAMMAYYTSSPNADKTFSDVAAYFPDNYTVAEGAAVTSTNGKLNTSTAIKITASGTEFSLIFKDGVATVTPNPYEAE